MIDEERVEKLLASYRGEIIYMSKNRTRLVHLNEFEGKETMTRIEVTLPSKENTECEIYATTKYCEEWEPKPFICKYKPKEERFFMSDLVHCLDTFHFVKRNKDDDRERLKAVESKLERALSNYEFAEKNGDDFMMKRYKARIMELKQEKEELERAGREL